MMCLSRDMLRRLISTMVMIASFAIAEPSRAADAVTSERLSDDRLAIALEAISRLKGMDIDANPALRKSVLKVLDAVKGTPKAVEIVRDFDLKDQAGAMLDYAATHPTDSSGVDAVRYALANMDEATIAAKLVGTNAIVAGLVQAIGNSAENLGVKFLQPIIKDTQRDVSMRRLAMNGLAQTQDGANFLLDLAKEKKLPNDLKLATSSALRSVRWPEIAKQANELFPPLQGQGAEALPPITELVKRTGDPKKGAEVFRRDTVGCIKCHQVNGEGVDIGPKLSEIGTKLGKDALYEAILDPSAGISFGFEAWRVELKNGDEAFGLIVSETPEELTVKAQTGITTRYKKNEIARREVQKLSLMPVGLQQAMTTQELVDLVEYLSTLKAAKN